MIDSKMKQLFWVCLSVMLFQSDVSMQKMPISDQVMKDVSVSSSAPSLTSASQGVKRHQDGEAHHAKRAKNTSQDGD